MGDGDEVLLGAPYADFRKELARLDLTPGRFEHAPAPEGDFATQTLDAETADLTAALRKADVPDGDAVVTVVAYQKNRSRLNDYVRARDIWNNLGNVPPWQRGTATPTNPPVPPQFEVPAGLPGEFADYFAGAVAWRLNPDDATAAQQAWQRVLARPAAARKYKSTWAAFMLGRSWEDRDADEAVKYFRLTRELARKNFADSVGLAAAALGWEARVELERGNLAAALKLYVEQYTTGDRSAVGSLRVTAERLFHSDAAVLAGIARDPQLRAVFMAYLISERMPVDAPPETAPETGPMAVWLGAVEQAGVTEVAAAEQLALMAYQAGEFALAQGWIHRAKGSALARWLQAKLYLHAGKTGSAAAVFAKLARELPPVAAAETSRPELLDRLTVNDRPGRDQLRGEWGVLALSRGDFAEALDALVRAGFWEDAAYVAESVLTTDELKAYVDANWPGAGAGTNGVTAGAAAETGAEFYDAPELPDFDPTRLRELLARRLVRESRGGEAGPYFSAEWRDALRRLLAALDAGRVETAPAAERAQHLFGAAWIVRTNGLEMLGTELGPDWAIHGGRYDWGLTPDSRRRGDDTKINGATEAELDRAARHRADPDQRFHYRYQAALLAWEAAKLLPDNDVMTARVLCHAGTWLKVRDPDTADLFYKALVRRCRQTAIGAQADRMRWFPVLDEQGNPKPYKPAGPPPEGSPGLEVPPESPEDAGAAGGEGEAGPVPPPQSNEYIVQSGDSLLGIAHAASTPESVVTLRALVAANPGLDPQQLRIGQRLRIPAGVAVPEHVGIAPARANALTSPP